MDGRKRPAEAAERGADDFRGVVDQVPLAIVVAQDGRFVYANATMRQLAAQRGASLTRLDFVEFVHPEDRAEIADRYARVMRGEGWLGPFEFRSLGEDGAVRWFRSSSIRVTWRGRPAVASAIEEISEAKRAARALRESEERYRQLVEHTPIGICEIDVQSRRFLSVNDVMCDILGYGRAELLRMSWHDIMTGRSVASGDARRERALQGLALTEPVEHHVRARDGRELWVLVSVRLVQDLDGSMRANVVAHDITARRRVEEEQQKVEKLESLGVLAGGIAHDFNNILTAALSSVGLAKQHLTAPQRLASVLGDAERACLRARGLAQQLLTFARGGEPVRTLVDPRALAEDCVRFALRGSRSSCVVRAPEPPWPVEADESQLSQVMHNLALNADQAMPRGGTVELAIANVELDDQALPNLPAGRYVRLSVRDEGAGIEPSHLPKIFDPYFTTKPSGSGLGLATSYSIVKRHGGHIEVDTELGRGTVIRIYLPAVQRPVSTSENAPPSQRPRSARVLLMDDEPLVRRTTAELLHFLGHEVDTAHDGAAALALYRQQRAEGHGYDLVIVDLTVQGGQGGLEALAELQALDPAVRAIVASGYSEAPVLADYRAHGFRAAVRKPYTLDELEAAISEALSD